ncbi:methyl-accepting chemotaxis protein, partial [Rhizobium leguminosarum]
GDVLADRRKAGLQVLIAGKTRVIGTYGKAFEEIVALQARRDALISKVTEFGPWTSIALNDVVCSAWRQDDVPLLQMT